MNLYEYSERNNKEMGVAATSGEEIHDDAIKEVQSIRRVAEKRFLPEESPGSGTDLSELFGAGRSESNGIDARGDERGADDGRSKDGYCIRCEDRIPHKPDRLFCADRFKM
jgi:hypothetical protein